MHKIKYKIFPCILCKKYRNEKLYKVIKYGIYGVVAKYRFHPICLKQRLSNPEQYGNI